MFLAAISSCKIHGFECALCLLFVFGLLPALCLSFFIDIYICFRLPSWLKKYQYPLWHELGFDRSDKKAFQELWRRKGIQTFENHELDKKSQHLIMLFIIHRRVQIILIIVSFIFIFFIQCVFFTTPFFKQQ